MSLKEYILLSYKSMWVLIFKPILGFFNFERMSLFFGTLILALGIYYFSLQVINIFSVQTVSSDIFVQKVEN